MTVGVRIQQRRQRLQMSQAELARRAGLKYPTLHKIEHDRHEPVSSNLKAIALALHCSTDWLLGMYDEEFDVPEPVLMEACDA